MNPWQFVGENTSVLKRRFDKSVMITDPLFYRLFATSPETFFLLLGMSIDDAREMAARYEYQAIEFKETSHRTDGVFLPKEPSLPIYFLEVQFYSLPSVFADLLAKAYTYLKQNDPAQPFRGVVLFASRALEPADVTPYRPLLEARYVQRYYLDELQEVPNSPLGLSILQLIGRAESEAAATARDIVVRAKAEITDAALRADVIELIETVIMYKLAGATREEIQTMLQISDLRNTRVYQEALEEGERKGLARAVVKLAEKQMSADEIAKFLDVEIEFVRQVLNGRLND
jgi:predicted transposase/invertase (TIGR01784 family)